MASHEVSPEPCATALVTGASRGIGRAIAAGLIREGLTVVLLARDRAAVSAVCCEIGGVPIACDVSSPRDVTRAMEEAVAAVGPIDLLVNNAGVCEPETSLWEADPELWWRTMEVNVRGPFLLERALVPSMVERGAGRIVDLSSGAASHDMLTASAYNASKTALARMGAHLHDAGFDRGLRVFEVAPGVVATDMTADMPMHEGRTEWTPVERTVELVTAIARGELDACSGWFMRAGMDTVEALQALAASGSAPPNARRLRMLPAGPADAAGATLVAR
ncbi:MAG: SDR family oxidoreductase [Cellulomonadaceae bacterium]|nr:SDR family oxidoreductase [Cellulomonadaceae bacterium]